ncbi:hypothetical protein J0X15_15180 [Roseibium sp. CAU 1637]|uniref:Uncharacterized protein n=1 Tax=Roseibium limicola TaxID=2816037 RepID=A0A939EQ14_9HYPH|nr:hypothetical protein [Roseibium limicola]MBO0346574.1 hypothetical protein [Roseibium limicola]
MRIRNVMAVKLAVWAEAQEWPQSRFIPYWVPKGHGKTVRYLSAEAFPENQTQDEAG